MSQPTNYAERMLRLLSDESLVRLRELTYNINPDDELIRDVGKELQRRAVPSFPESTPTEKP